ncbi:Uncharacterised protein [uncultured archaeon]|nr:Uncharacterised protein [uncultured archaeon]
MELETIYRTIFKEERKEDFERLEFLERVVSGKFPFGDQLVDLDDAMEMDAIDASPQFDYQSERYSGVMEAIRTAREWYKRFGSTRQEGKEQIAQALMTAEISSVLDTLDDCLQVLETYREKTEFINLLRSASKTPKKNRTSAIYATAETLLNTITNKESREQIYRFVELYERKIVRDFNRAVKRGKPIRIANAFMELSFTHEPDLIECAKNKLRH